MVVECGPLAGGGVHQDQPLDGDDALHQDDAQRNQEQRHRAGQASAHTQQMIGQASAHTQQMIGHTSEHTTNDWSHL